MPLKNIIYKIWDLYYDGFKNMRLGKTLWMIIIVKLIIIFVVLKIFFFNDFLSERAPKGNKAEYVSTQIINRVKP